MKTVSGARYVPDTVKSSRELHLKHCAVVVFVIIKEVEFLCEISQSGKRRKSNDIEGSRIATSICGLTAQIGISVINEIVGQGPSTSCANACLIRETSLGVELLLPEDVVGIANVCQRSNRHPSHSTKTVMKDFFELNPQTVLEP